MPLRRRLFVFVFIAVAVLYLAFGFFGVYQTREQLIADIDADLISTVGSAELVASYSTEELVELLEQTSDAPTLRALVDVNDGLLTLQPASRDGRQLALPDDDALRPEALVGRLDRPTTLESSDGSVDYRLIATRIEGGRLLVTGHPLDRVDSLTRQFLAGTVVNGLIILLAMAIAVYLAIRSGLRPLGTFIETTTRVAEGDLSERVDTNQDDPAFNQIAKATNHMLDEIQAATDAERHGQQRVNALVSDAAHELRTPLTAIRGTVSLRQMGALSDPADIDRAFAGIDEHSARMASIVEDVVTIARAENQRLDPDADSPEVVDLAAIAATEVEAFRRTHPGRSVEIVDPGREHIVRASAPSLRLAIAHLLANVAQHTPVEASAVVSIDGDDEWVRLHIADTGPGVPADLASTVFERFVRSDPSRARETGGAGLGLSVVRSIVESAHGAVSVSPNSPKGSIFTIEVPRHH